MIFNLLFGRPLYVDGYTINYADPFREPCVHCGSTTYQTKEEYTLCYCPKCRRLLVHY